MPNYPGQHGIVARIVHLWAGDSITSIPTEAKYEVPSCLCSEPMGPKKFYLVCFGNWVVREQYVVITSGLAAVALFCSWFYSKKCGHGLGTR